MPDKETLACTPVLVQANGFNPKTVIPYGLKTAHIRKAMEDFIDFLGFINTQLRTKQMLRLESFLMPANFSSMVGEFMAAAIPKYCKAILKNRYHNGHPDLVPQGHIRETLCCTARKASNSRPRDISAVGRDTTRRMCG